MVTIPTSVSRTPQRFMLFAEGLRPRVRATRIMAAAMTKRPEQRRREMISLRWRGTRRVQRRGTGMARMSASVLVGGIREGVEGGSCWESDLHDV